jgi:hypothetical protein
VSDCFICAKHADPATQSLVVAADEQVVVARLPLATPAGAQERAYLGSCSGGRAWTSGRTRRAATERRSPRWVERLRGHQIVSNANS